MVLVLVWQYQSLKMFTFELLCSDLRLAKFTFGHQPYQAEAGRGIEALEASESLSVVERYLFGGFHMSLVEWGPPKKRTHFVVSLFGDSFLSLP